MNIYAGPMTEDTGIQVSADLPFAGPETRHVSRGGTPGGLFNDPFGILPSPNSPAPRMVQGPRRKCCQSYFNRHTIRFGLVEFAIIAHPAKAKSIA